MQRRALLTALTACCAAAAFAVGAVAFEGAVADAGPSVEGGDGPTRNGSGVPNGSASGGSRGGGQPGAGGCLVCGLSARALADGLLPALSPLLLVGLAAVVVTGAALLGLRPGGGPADSPAAGGTDTRNRGAASGEVPGPPDAPATNDVYRAWATLTDRVDVARHETATPGEYARAAVERGLDRDVVERLRAMFTAVRYGDAPVTDERERAARAAADRLDGGTSDEGESTTNAEEDEA
ncbi:DUF4129 domain-containing protein [Halorientalis marina]|uniref:DUF4129 domain-containing protein n=1 Tax=Halorientalis marina TaxID=2931976 RepID=UPI001FF5995B|nr:DUF4129 domain-containing protein [Halorientalis marina]